MSLTPEQQALRDGKIGASFLPYLMAGDERRIYNEWRWQVGDPEYVPDDLSDNWDVQFGSFVEDFVLSWHEKATGQVLTRRREVVNHPTLPFVCATLDAWREVDNHVLDCKVTKKTIEDVCAFYLPQIIGQRDCVSADGGGLLIVHWAREPKEYILNIPDDYCRQVWDRVEWFWSYVEALCPPIEIAPVTPPVIPTKKVDMSGSNRWCIYAGKWREDFPAATRFAATVEELKRLAPADAACTYGGGVELTRNKRGAATIKEQPSG